MCSFCFAYFNVIILTFSSSCLPSAFFLTHRRGEWESVWLLARVNSPHAVHKPVFERFTGPGGDARTSTCIWPGNLQHLLSRANTIKWNQTKLNCSWEQEGKHMSPVRPFSLKEVVICPYVCLSHLRKCLIVQILIRKKCLFVWQRPHVLWGTMVVWAQ